MPERIDGHQATVRRAFAVWWKAWRRRLGAPAGPETTEARTAALEAWMHQYGAFGVDAQRFRAAYAALLEIAHTPEYDGSLCPDPDDCPNCVASKALATFDSAYRRREVKRHPDQGGAV